MLACPDDGQPLSAAAVGLGCGRCGGALVEAVVLERLAPATLASLTLETNLQSGAFLRTRGCPACAAPMVPWRMGQTEAWVERCNTCESFWLERHDLRAFEAHSQREARRRAVATLSPEERREFTQTLAETAIADVPERLSPAHAFLAMLGLPVVTGTRAHRQPLATWGLVLALVAVQLASSFSDAAEGLQGTLGYLTGQSGAVACVTALFVHAGWLHLLGNAWFLLTFGDGLEQRLSRQALVTAFCVLGALTTVAEAALAGDGVLILGASGAVSVVMGACFVLQPNARVTIALPLLFLVRVRSVQVLRVPMWLFGALELGWQGLNFAAGIPGVAWVAHLTGLALGLGLGVAARSWLGPAAAPA